MDFVLGIRGVEVTMRELVSAEEEYQKYPELKREDVRELTEWIRQHPEYPTPTGSFVYAYAGQIFGHQQGISD